MKLAIMQPYFLPYLGYWQLIGSVDKFVVYDDVNFIKSGWINRNRILSNGNINYLTIPLHQASPNKLICEVEFNTKFDWRGKIFKTLQAAYGRAPEYKNVSSLLEAILYYDYDNITDFLVNQIHVLSDFMGLETTIQETSRIYKNSHLRGQERVIDICKQEGADTYINPIGGKDLYDHASFAEHNIKLSFIDPVIKPYKQTKGDFIPYLSIIDVMMFNSQQQCQQMVKEYHLV